MAINAPPAPRSNLAKMLASSPAEESMLASWSSAPLAESEGQNSAHPLGTPPLFLDVPHAGDTSIKLSSTPTERDAHLAMGRFTGRAATDDVPPEAGGLPLSARTPSPQRSPIALGSTGSVPIGPAKS